MSSGGITAREARAQGCQSAGEVAEQLGITNRTLHFYEEEGLIEPVRTSGGTRFYPDQQVRRAEASSTLVRLGFPVKVVRELVDAARSADTGDDLARRTGGVLAEFRARVAVQIDELRRLDDDLVATQALVRRCAGCESPVADCPGCFVAEDEPTMLLPLLTAEGR